MHYLQRFDWHHFQMDPFIDCFEINCTYETRWNQTDRSKSDMKAWENLRVLWRASPLPPRAEKPFKAVATQRPVFAETSLMMSKPDLCSLQTSTSYFGKLCFFNTSTYSLFCSREHQRAGCPSFLNHSDNYMKIWEGALVNVDSKKILFISSDCFNGFQTPPSFTVVFFWTILC